MAVSPLVQQYQQQMAQGEEQPQKDEKTIFNSKFGESAYKSFTSKYPQLVEYVVTFKVIESDTENGRGIGAFIIKYGSDVLYVPTVLAEGSISSCEMVYDKKEDTFWPLIQSNIRDIVNKNKLRDPKMLKQSPKVDSTRDMFKNMFRPPSSTNPVFASNASIDQLPDSAKDRISNYLQGKPEVLAKLAEVYPIKALAEKLSKSEKIEKQASEPVAPDVIGLESLTKEAAENLTEEQKKTILNDGFLVKKADTADYVPGKELVTTLVTKYDISQRELKDTYGTGKIVIFDPSTGNVEFLPAIITPDRIIYKYNGENYFSFCGRSILISEFENYISEQDLNRFGASSVTEPRLHTGASIFFYPTKSENFYKSVIFSAVEYSWQVMDEDVKVYDLNNPTDGLYFSRDITHGKVKNVLPYDSYYLNLDNCGKLKILDNFDEFFSLVNGLGVNIRLNEDGAGYTVSDSYKKVVSLPNSREKVAEYLTETYDLGHDSIKTLMETNELFVLRKEASVFTNQPEVQEGPEITHTPYPEIIDDTIDVGDDELIETGMIASVADDEEAKPMLIDMMPRFVQTSSDIGKTILLMNYEQDSFEDFYGTEEYNNTLSKLRRIFKSIGEIMADLRKYINMQ